MSDANLSTENSEPNSSICNECGKPLHPTAKTCIPCYKRTFSRIARETVEPASVDPNRTLKVLYGHPGPRVVFFCPGCETDHTIPVGGDEPCKWSYNGNPEAPTFTPSILAHETAVTPRCHSYVTNGDIKFLGDCSHKLAGQTVPLPKW
jgi:hypothetical protein